ncbi:DMT family transporter [Kocuria turfanensis]|uniref:Permease n=1 Tax=Kocuria turfanensis TaxID=388357 RepID=A0A512IHL2_9MICC|nr:EamA family transporter [Kocuria turfanensis]GEO97195.1 permease [Kocuria turfanensis]
MRGRAGGIAAILVTSVLWGTTGTAATFAPGAGPLAIGAAALGIGGLLQAAIALPALRRAQQALRTHAGLVALGAVAVAIYPLAFYSSMRLGGVAIGTVVSLASAPLASGVLERVIERLPLSRWWKLAAFLGILGSGLLCLARAGDSAASAPATAASIGLGLVAGTTYALYSWVVHRLMGHEVGRAASMGAVFGVGGALLMPVLLLTGAPLLHSAQAFTAAAYTALVPMFLGYFLFGLGLTRVRPSTATTLTLTEPAVAAVLAVLVVGERLSGLGWTGLTVIGVALVVLALAPANVEADPGALRLRGGGTGADRADDAPSRADRNSADRNSGALPSDVLSGAMPSDALGPAPESTHVDSSTGPTEVIIRHP